MASLPSVREVGARRLVLVKTFFMIRYRGGLEGGPQLYSIRSPVIATILTYICIDKTMVSQ